VWASLTTGRVAASARSSYDVFVLTYNWPAVSDVERLMTAGRVPARLVKRQ